MKIIDFKTSLDMKLIFLCFFLLSLCLTQQSCAQKNEHKTEVKLKPSHQDSVKMMSYWEKANQVGLFSSQRQLYLDSALMVMPENAYFWQQKAMPLFKMKKYEIGMPYLDNAVKYDKENHWLEYRAFIKCIFQKSYREAIKDFDAAQKKVGNSYVMDHTYEFYKGLCYLQLNKIDSAEYLISKCLVEERKKMKPDWIHPLHLFYMGIVHYEKEEYDKAIENFDVCLTRYAEFSDAQYYKALCLGQKGDKKQALTLLLEAKSNLSRGYTINEDNALYEAYPYQLNKYFLDGYIQYLKEINR